MIDRLRYRGPSLEELHEHYAKQRRIDHAAPIRSEHQVKIEAPVERVWALLGDPTGWPEIDPAVHDVRLDGPVQVDTHFTWRNGSTRLRSRFAVVDACSELTWTGNALGSRAVHRHVLTPDGGTTVLRTEESMAGMLLGLVYDSRKLHAALVRWLGAVKASSEQT